MLATTFPTAQRQAITACVPWVIKIDYDRGDQGTYRFTIVEVDGVAKYRSGTGRPDFDFLAAVFWAAAHQAPAITFDASCHEFPFDGERYVWTYNSILQMEVLTPC